MFEMRKVTMVDQRQNLLHQLRGAYALEQNVERSLRWFNDRHAGQAALVSTGQEYLKQTLAQQQLLGKCLHRIEGDGQITQSENVNLPADILPAPPAQPGVGNVDKLFRLPSLTLEGIDTYTSCIATAESGGFFETKFTCEGILVQKFALSAWLSGDNFSMANYYRR
jgi:ferritin-like metal-binding protein YciE